MFMKKKEAKKDQLKYIFFIRSFWVLFFSGLFFLVIIFSSAALGYFGDMPDLQQLENPFSIRFTRKKIAGIKTILKEYELGIRKADK